jgi:hypothetical protein
MPVLAAVFAAVAATCLLIYIRCCWFKNNNQFTTSAAVGAEAASSSNLAHMCHVWDVLNRTLKMQDTRLLRSKLGSLTTGLTPYTSVHRQHDPCCCTYIPTRNNRIKCSAFANILDGLLHTSNSYKALAPCRRCVSHPNSSPTQFRGLHTSSSATTLRPVAYNHPHSKATYWHYGNSVFISIGVTCARNLAAINI